LTEICISNYIFQVAHWIHEELFYSFRKLTIISLFHKYPARHMTLHAYIVFTDARLLGCEHFVFGTNIELFNLNHFMIVPCGGGVHQQSSLGCEN